MDNSRDFQDSLFGPSASMLNPHRVSGDAFALPSGGLMRYHSAPSSTFAALLESDFYSAHDSSELVQFLTDSGLNDFSSSGDAGLSMKLNHKPVSGMKKEQRPQQGYSCQNDILLRHNGRVASSFPECIGQGPLSAILEHAGEETCVAQPCQPNVPASSSLAVTIDSSNEYKTNLIRHSSLPTDFLSRLATVDMSERPVGSQQVGSHMPSTSQQVSSHMQTSSPRTTDNTGGKVYLVSSTLSPRGLPVRKCFTDEVGPCKEEEYGILDSELSQHCGLLRQSSSPAGLLSQLTLDEFANGTDKVPMSTTQGLVIGGWDEASMDSAMHKIAALGQRKRGRPEVDARLLKSLPAADLLMGSLDQITSSPPNHYPLMGSSSGDSMVTDSILCKSRAKRGCATHPRSIAERVRRTKISERIKKLQDLVPNLDKQAHTADMLDEVVEYVKLLKRQVEELSKPSCECNGMCQKKGNVSVET
ncbi:hypothetical protein GOP47_0017636 [Adiantum capillus-veneris]|uniref:BHLH domain-containing protein n=1 Tax=Adiantum capillus-veneris TaxID=13818 RepID=A0A9D4UFQ6_ADICA|nr:hypothetical protein GOP47_0017636 [Adiantum capillus-veneris]